MGIFKEFTPGSHKGKKFTEMWNSGYKDGLQPEIAREFGMSVCTAVKIRKKLNLEPLFSGNHPGRQKFLSEVKSMYEIDGVGTAFIGNKFGMCSANIQQELHKMNIKMKPQHTTNPLYFRARNNMDPEFMVSEIKRLYKKEKMKQKDIARKLRIDPSTVNTKLRAMGIRTKPHCSFKPGGYPCNWCNTLMKKVYQNSGPRKQIYCSHTCKERAKDYRRMLNGKRESPQRLQSFENYLKETWKDKYEQQKNNIVNPNPWNTPVSIKIDEKILSKFRWGVEYATIGKRLGISTSTVITRLKHILRDYKVELKYKSNLSGRWKTMGRVNPFNRELSCMRNRLQKTLGYEPDIRLWFHSNVIGVTSMNLGGGGYNDMVKEVNKDGADDIAGSTEGKL